MFSSSDREGVRIKDGEPFDLLRQLGDIRGNKDAGERVHY
jgi:hypothetical protein